LINYVSAWAVCKAKSISTNELLLGVETAYPMIMLKWELRKNEPKKEATLQEIWDLLIKLIGRACRISDFEECLKVVNAYFQDTSRISFYNSFDIKFKDTLQEKIKIILKQLCM
jgi:hypothetical protein